MRAITWSASAQAGSQHGRSLLKRLSDIDLPTKTNYPVIDSTGEGWGLYLFPSEAVLSPMAVKKRWSKREVIHLYNQRKNVSENESPYSEKSLSSKRIDRIIREIADLLSAAE
jgi:hypothetical protein